MTWKAIARSEKGTRHSKLNMPCQDYSNYKVINNAIVGVVADGAGSAKHSDIGAQTAVNKVLEIINERDIQNIDELLISDGYLPETEKHKPSAHKLSNLFNRSNKDEEGDITVAVKKSNSEYKTKQFFVEIVKQVTTALNEQAETNDYAVSDLASTLLIAIATPNGIAAMQTGDGFITVRYPNSPFQLLFPPDKGEYVNETIFVTSSNALKDMRVIVQPGQPEFVCASTDGLERLAIRMSDWTPFTPFFQPLEQYLRETNNPEESDEYLINFLKSDRLNARTDDDKTLFLCLYDRSNSPQ